LNSVKSIKQKSLFKIIAVSFFSLAALIVLFFSVLFVLFLIYKNDISTALLLGVNNKIEGNISFSDLSFTPFRHFPNASLVINELTLKESEDPTLGYNSLHVFNIKETFVSLNLLDLLSSKLSVSKITFDGGNVNIIVYPDSQTNIQKAIKKITQKKSVVKEKQTTDADTTRQKRETTTKSPPSFSLNIDELSIDDLELSFENQFKKNKILLKINELQSEFSYVKNQIICSINLNTKIDSLIKNEKVLLSDQLINFKSNLEVDTDSMFVKLRDGYLSIGEANFLFNGIFDSKNQGYLDLSFSGLDEDFSLFSLLLSEDGMKNLKSGDFVFEGTVVGKTLIEFPSIDISLGLKNVELINPITNRKIKNLNLAGYFNSGKADDWSDAKIKIDTLYADLRDGNVKLSGSVRNFILPEIDINIFLSGDVTGLDRVFKSESIKDLKGNIKLTDRIKGKYDFKDKKFISSVNRGSIFFNDFGVRIPGAIRFDKVSGSIRRENDDFYFDSLSVISEDTDILINGKVQNLTYLFFNIEKDIEANLEIKSSVFDLPNFLAFDPSIKRDFNYRILDLDVSVIAKTTTTKATKFKSFPEIEFDIKRLDATVENFLPRLEINSGIYKISESILGFNMKFDKFKTDFLDGKFNFNAEYNTSKFQPFYIKMKADFNQLSLSKLFYTKNDTVSDSMKGKLSGSFFTEFQFPTDSTILNFVKMKNANLVYEFSKDTIVTKNLEFEFNKIYFNDNINPNPLAILYTNGRVKSDNFKYGSFNFRDLDFDLNVINGDYEIKSNTVRIFGDDARGQVKIKATPFADVPKFNIAYNDISFLSEKMLSAFNESPVISRPLKISFNISSTGSEWDTIVSTMNGTINLSGKNLILNGLDADEIIEDFKRSQKFNLVDLGAVLLAGPVGIVVTKGSDFARLLVFNSGKYTTINELASNWTVENGVFEIQDAAFATNKNRIALIGNIGFSKNNLDLIIALLNKNGCSIFSQEVSGNLSNPTIGKVKVVGTMLAPITNLVDDATGKDCDVFYNGLVEHPKNKTKKN
jgi:AsmA protein